MGFEEELAAARRRVSDRDEDEARRLEQEHKAALHVAEVCKRLCAEVAVPAAASLRGAGVPSTEMVVRVFSGGWWSGSLPSALVRHGYRGWRVHDRLVLTEDGNIRVTEYTPLVRAATEPAPRQGWSKNLSDRDEWLGLGELGMTPGEELLDEGSDLSDAKVFFGPRPGAVHPPPGALAGGDTAQLCLQAEYDYDHDVPVRWALVEGVAVLLSAAAGTDTGS